LEQHGLSQDDAETPEAGFDHSTYPIDDNEHIGNRELLPFDAESDPQNINNEGDEDEEHPDEEEEEDEEDEEEEEEGGDNQDNAITREVVQHEKGLGQHQPHLIASDPPFHQSVPPSPSVVDATLNHPTKNDNSPELESIRAETTAPQPPQVSGSQRPPQKPTFASVLMSNTSDQYGLPLQPQLQQQISHQQKGPQTSPLHNTGLPIKPTLMPPKQNYPAVTDGSSVYVRNVPFNVTQEKLERLFTTFGTIKSINMTFVPQKGYTFISYVESDSAHRAITSSKPLVLDGRALIVEERKNKSDFQQTYQRGRGINRRGGISPRGGAPNPVVGPRSSSAEQKTKTY